MMTRLYVTRNLLRVCSRGASTSSATTGFLPYLEELQQRGLLSITYPQNMFTTYRDNMRQLPPVAYAGFDATSSSLHVGNLIVLLNLLRASKHGIRPIVLIGGATAAIGDPSGRLSERDTLAYSEIHANREALAENLRGIVERLLPQGNFELLDNYEWYKDLGCLDYLRRCKPVTLAEMMQLGAIRQRLDDGQSISFSEFSYQTLQAQDWLYLAQKYNCLFQLGGSDQLGHLNVGAHYIKKTTDKQFAAGICLPLLTDASGNKIGKSTGSPVWLSSRKTSNFHFYQYFVQLHDTDAAPLYEKLSLRPLSEVREILSEHASNLGKWIAQKHLAEEMTEIVRGKQALQDVQRISQLLFYKKGWDEFCRLPKEELLSVFSRPICLDRKQAQKMTFGELADLANEEGQKGSFQMINGAFKVNGKKVTTPDQLIPVDSVLLGEHSDLTLIGFGKRDFNLVVWTDKSPRETDDDKPSTEDRLKQDVSV